MINSEKKYPSVCIIKNIRLFIRTNGIGKKQLLKENLFLLFIAVVTKIALIIVG